MIAEEERADWSREPTERPLPDRIVDDLLPEDLDWREMVRSYPRTAIALAAVGGFLVGRRHGAELLSAVGAFVDREVSKNIHTLLGE